MTLRHDYVQWLRAQGGVTSPVTIRLLATVKTEIRWRLTKEKKGTPRKFNIAYS
jgi:hypothetical protein